jgi:hypothetical protein
VSQKPFPRNERKRKPMNANSALTALNAMLAIQAARSAEIDSARKADSAPAATPVATEDSVQAETLPEPIKGGQGADASGFSVWRGKRATGPGFVAGMAGADHEARKMRASLLALARTAVTESDEHCELANIADRNRDNCAKDGTVDDALGYAQDGILERGMSQLKLALAENILDEVSRNDVDALTRRYRDAGNALAAIEEVIAVSTDPAALASMEPATRSDARRARCRAALAREAAKDSAPDATPAPLADVSAADREAARQAEIDRLAAESAADDTTQVDSYLE